MITLALAKGRIFEETLPLLAAAGIAPAEDPETSRKLILATQRPGPAPDPGARRRRARPTCSTARPTSASPGATCSPSTAAQGLYQPLDLGIARCRMVVAVPEGFDYAAAVRQGARLRVATKYIRTAREHFAAKGVHVDLIKLYGSMELAPLVGLADAIVDLVDTGNTLRANRLRVVEEIMPVSSRLIVNPASLKLKRDADRAADRGVPARPPVAELRRLATRRAGFRGRARARCSPSRRAQDDGVDRVDRGDPRGRAHARATPRCSNTPRASTAGRRASGAELEVPLAPRRARRCDALPAAEREALEFAAARIRAYPRAPAPGLVARRRRPTAPCSASR